MPVVKLIRQRKKMSVSGARQRDRRSAALSNRGLFRDHTCMRQTSEHSTDYVRGDATGLALPAHEQALRAAGETFLTDAFRAFGSIDPDNRIVRISRIEPFAGGNSGHKLLLSVDYALAQPGLHTDLFVKFSRDFADPFRDRRRHELESEVRLARLSRKPGFPIAVPRPYFGDFHCASGTGLIITQRIPFGRDGIEPLRPKCMDHELEQPLEYYQATVTALAHLAAAHKCGALSPEADALFPFDPALAMAEIPIPWTEAQLGERIARYARFAAQCPRLLPARLAAPAFISRLERDAARFVVHEAAVKRYLLSKPDYLALCHWNSHIDNAWFWRDASGTLKCGLLDWALVRQMNVATGLWGGLCGASWELWDRHLDELLVLFIGELRARGGPTLERSELRLHLDLTTALLGLALMMDVPALVLSRVPEAASAAGPLDPVFQGSEVARTFLHVFTMFLSLWEGDDFSAALDRALS